MSARPLPTRFGAVLSALILSIAALATLAADPAAAAEVLLIDTAPAPEDFTDSRCDGAISLRMGATETTTVTRLEAQLDITSAANVRFAIFDHPGHTLLSYSDPVPVSPGLQFVSSPAMSFTMTAGQDYDLAAMVDGCANFPWDTVAAGGGGLVTYANNGNPTNYASPVHSGDCCSVDPRFLIYGGPAEADISVTKDDGVTIAVPGDPITYTITVANAGPTEDPSVAVADTFPVDLTCTYTSVAAGGATGNTPDGAGDIADTLGMPMGSSVTYTATCLIAIGAAPLSNTATATASLTDPDPSNNSATDDDTGFPVVTVGLVDTSTAMWHLRNSVGGVTTFEFGNPGDLPIVGDWDGDGVATPGLYRQSDGFFYARNSNTTGVADASCFAGNPQDVPVAGDWDGDGDDTLGLYRPDEQMFHLFNDTCVGAPMGVADISFLFGNPGDEPVSGDWDDDSIDEVGLHREATGLFYWRVTNDTGIASDSMTYGNPGDRFVSGDWGLVDGIDTPAIFRHSDLSFYFRHTLSQGPADSDFVWAGAGSDWLPVAGTFGLG